MKRLQKWLSLKSDQANTFVYVKPQEQSSVVKDYSFSPTKVSMALLASNDCVYFYNLEKKCLTGTQLFNKRHHGATSVLFNPIMNNVLVVYGGPNGLIVYNLEDTHQFLHQPLHVQRLPFQVL